MTQSRQESTLRNDDRQAFIAAVQSGRLDMINQIITDKPTYVADMVAANDFEAFREAASNGHLPVLERLIELAPEYVVDINTFLAFRYAALHGHLPVMERLMALAPERVADMVVAGDFGAFRGAALNGHLPVMERLMELAPERVADMVAADGFFAFRHAARNGHLPVVERLTKLAPELVTEMVEAQNFLVFRDAVWDDLLPVVNCLLTLPSVFAYAEPHTREYSHCITPFTHTTLNALRTEKTEFSTQYPQGVFDVVDTEKVRLYFYLLRSMIRRNDPALLDDILFLLDIPAVKVLIHTAVTPGQPNELLRLAQSVGNQAAAQIVLNIPAVRDLAAANNYYRNEQRHGLDLKALAHDRESSMRALTQGEQARLGAALAYYQPLIQQAGVTHLIKDLRDTLAARFNAHPAHITRVNSQELVLPLTWDDFQATALSAHERQQALKAYYQHKDHSAWRYLSKPNPWMSEQAGYVYINPEHTARWSTFEDYSPLISMLYLAAIDATQAPTDGFTFETRLEHFIDELAHINRAHNWDRTRINAALVSEEYDDLGADKPSCYSGVKRRLLQAVLGHPLLKILTKDDIKHELREFVREHFKQVIQAGDGQALHHAWQQLIDSGHVDDCLIELNIPKEKQQYFIRYLSEKYPNQFDDDLGFKAYAVQRLMQTPHAQFFGGETDLTGLLEAHEPHAAPGMN